MSREDSFQF